MGGQASWFPLVMSRAWSCATLREGVAAVEAEALQATPEAEEAALLKQIEVCYLMTTMSFESSYVRLNRVFRL